MAIILNNFQEGIAPSQVLGIARMSETDITSFPGAARINYTVPTDTGSSNFTDYAKWIVLDTQNNVLYAMDADGVVYSRASGTWTAVSGNQTSTSSKTFTVDTGTEILTLSGSDANITPTGTGVFVTSTSSLPSPLVAGTQYFVINASATTIQLATSYANAIAGTAINITTAGSGTHTITNGGQAGNGLVYWKGYLFAFRNANVDLYGPLGNSPAWINTWAGIDNDSLFHPAIWGQDDILYVGAGRYVWSLSENTGTTFTPGTTAVSNSTCTLSTRALDLPQNYRIKCMAELGVNLMLGTWQGATITDIKVADIFPWDRVSPSFDIPFKLQENGVSQMMNKDNIIYAVAGTSGKLFASNGSSVRLVAQLPNYITALEGTYLEFFPGAIMAHQGRVWFGVSCTADPNNVHGNGLWSYDPDTNVLNWELNFAAGHVMGALFSYNRERYLLGNGKPSASSYQMRLSTNTSRATTSIIESQQYRVGTIIEPATFNKLSVELAKPLAADETIDILWREGTTDSFVSIPGTPFSTAGEQAFTAPANIKDARNVQIQVQMNGTASATSGPYLMEVRLD